ncbi:MAG: hypothetical protein IPO56_04295 [Flavobacteriales bacterium]|nr:hypothetical protein [Flavobacteriales bacterium]
MHTGFSNTPKGELATISHTPTPRATTTCFPEDRAIRQGVELFVGRTEGTIDEVKKLLVEVAVANQTPFTKGENNTIEAKAIDDERRKFIGYVMNLSNEDLLVVEPLPFRRRLSETGRALVDLLRTGLLRGLLGALGRSDAPSVLLRAKV